MGALYKSGIEMNRKVLADLAMNHPEAFTAILLKAKTHKFSLFASGYEKHENIKKAVSI